MDRGDVGRRLSQNITPFAVLKLTLNLSKLYSESDWVSDNETFYRSDIVLKCTSIVYSKRKSSKIGLAPQFDNKTYFQASETHAK